MQTKSFTAEQLQAIECIDQNLLITAGAGAGKTRVLVERYLNILQSKQIKANEILAITFTEKAGKEMTERVYQELTNRLMAPNGDKLFWQKKLQELSGAHIGTIHSLYNKIISENPIEADLDANFQLLTALTEKHVLESFKRQYLKTLFNQRNADLAVLYREYGGKIEELMQYVLNKAAYVPDAIEDFGAMFQDFTINEQDLLNSLQELQEALETLAQEEYKLRAKKKLTAAEQMLLALVDGGGCKWLLAERSSFEAFASSESGALIQKMEKRNNIAKLIKNAYEAVVSQINYLVCAQRMRELHPALTSFVFNYWQSWQKYKKENGYLSFDDLEIATLKLLRENKHIVQNYQQKYKYIMVDEFQDVNEQQREFVNLLTSGATNNLFLVGDEKQSIYGFRGANVNLFQEAQQEFLSKGDVVINLDTNFRSNAGIIEFVNTLFDNLTAENPSNINFHKSLANKISSQIAVKVNCVKTEQENLTNEQAKLRELEQLVSYIQFLLENQVPAHEIAVLVSKKSQITALTAILNNKNIKYSVLDQKGFFEDPYIRDILNIFQCINNRYARLQLIGALRSPFFAITDQTISELHESTQSIWETLANGKYQQLVADCQQQKFLQRAQLLLETLAERARFLNLPQLFREFLKLYNWREFLLSQPNPVQNISNLEYLQDLVTEFANNNSGYLSDFVDYLQNIDLSEECIPNILSNNLDSINIMTIHKSKGLEFDYVFIPHLQALNSRSKKGELLNFSTELGFAFKVTSPEGELLEPLKYLKNKEISNYLQKQEIKRLLYVGITRAKEQIILSGCLGKGDVKDNALNWITQYVPAQLYENLAELPNSGESLYKPVENIFDTKQFEQACWQVQDLSLPRNSKLEYLTATALLDYQNCPLSFSYKHLLKIPEIDKAFIYQEFSVGKDTFEGAELGRAVHKFLETKAVVDNNDQLWQNEFSPELLVKAEELAREYLASPVYLADAKYIKQREYSFNYYDSKLAIALIGVIDCLLVYPDNTLGIIDYKTGKLGETELEKYSLQVALYAGVIEKILKKTVKKVAIHHINDQAEYLINWRNYTAQLEALIDEVILATKNNEFIEQTGNCHRCTCNYYCPKATRADS